TTERPRIPRPRMIPAFCFTIALVAPQDLQTTASGWFSVMHREHWFMASPWGLGHARIGGGGPAEYGARSERGQDQPPTPQSPNRLIAYSPVLRYAARKSPARTRSTSPAASTDGANRWARKSASAAPPKASFSRIAASMIGR